MDEVKNIEKKKWFKRWWGILIIIFSLLIILFISYFTILVFRYKKAIESGDIINNLIGSYSKFDNPINNSEATISRLEIEAGDSPTLGAEDPIMTIVEFSDFDCPHCAVFYPVLKDFISEYQNKVKLIFKNFPLSDYKSALAAGCAFEQDRFWEMHDKLFYYQNKISDALIKSIAENIRLDMDSFNDCYDNEKYNEKIQKDLATGVKAGVEGTPTVFINGKKFVGVIPKEILKQILYAIEYEK